VIYISALAILLHSCSSSHSPFGETVYLQPEAINNELVVDMIHSISANDHYFTFVHSKTCRFYVFDSLGNLQFTFGVKGKGPAEFQWPGGIFMTDSLTIIYDEVRKSVLQYTVDGKYKREIVLKTGVSRSRFCYHRGYLYFHAMDEYPVKKVNMQTGEQVKGFGEFYPPFHTVKDRYFNNMYWYLQPCRETVLAVNAHHAEVNIYNTDGKILRKLSFPELEKFFRILNKSSLSKLLDTPPERFALIHISDISVDRDKLFLLLTRSPEDPKQVQINTILVIDLKSGNINDTLKLPGRMYFGMAVRNGHCAVYNYSDAQCEFYMVPQKIYGQKD